jgi:hypothetical protein
MRTARRGIHLVSAYDLVFKSEMKQVHHLLILRTLVSEQVLH